LIDKPAEDLSWVSYHLSKAAAADLYRENASKLEKYSLTKTDDGFFDYYID